MKAIHILHAAVGIVTSRSDGGVSFKIITPELTLDQRATLLGMHGKNVGVLVEPLDVAVTGMDEVTTEAQPKTQCERIRARLFVLYSKLNKPGSFDEFYHNRTERILEWIGQRIEEA